MTEMRGWVEVPLLATVATLAVLLLSLLVRARASHGRERHLPPGPTGWPILGCLPLLGTLPHRSLYELSKLYGPIMSMNLGSIRNLVVTSPQMAEEILKTHDHIMAFRPGRILSRCLTYNGIEISCGPYGEQWRHLRKVVTVGLLTALRISQFRPIREREVLAALHFILAESLRGNAVNMNECFSAITMNNMSQMIMQKTQCVLHSSGSKSVLPETVLSETMKEVMYLMGAFNLADYVPVLRPFDPQGLLKRGKIVHRRLDKYLNEVIEEHRQIQLIPATEDYKEDFVDALLRIGRTKEFEFKPLSMDTIKAVLVDILLAGHTSSVTMLWALTELMRHPSVMQRVHEELDSVVGKQRLVQEDDLPDLHYLLAVVKETFRLHPPVPLLPHPSTQDCEIGGFHIPARTHVLVNVWGIHRDPAVWERPLEFDPDRFLNSKIDVKGQDFELIPFGSGRRICPGMNLGLLMVLYPLSLLLHAVDWTCSEGQRPEELDTSEAFGLVLHKQNPLTLLGKARLANHVIYPAQQA